MAQQLAQPAPALDSVDNDGVESPEEARQRELRRQRVLQRREELSRSAVAADPSAASPAATAALNQAVPMAPSPTTSTAPVASTSIREDVVKNATDFLTNPRVVSSSTDKKKMFLKTKGLSDDEINEAFRRAGSLQAAVPAQSQYAAQQPQQYQQVVPGARYAPPVPPPPMMGPPVQQIVSQSPSLRALVFIVVVCSGIGAGLVYFIRRYIIRYFWPRQSASEKLADTQQQLAAVQEAVNSQVSEVKEALGLIRTFLENQIDSVVEKNRIEEMRQRQEQARVSELKREIQNIQNLLPLSIKKNQSFDSPLADEATDMANTLKSIKSVVQTQRKDSAPSDLSSSGLARAISPGAAGGQQQQQQQGGRRLPSWMKTSPAIPEWQRTEKDSVDTQTTPSDVAPENVAPLLLEDIFTKKGSIVNSNDASESSDVITKPTFLTADFADAKSGGDLQAPYSASFMDVIKTVQSGQTPPNVRTDIDDSPENPDAEVPKGATASKPKPWEGKVDNTYNNEDS